jgi:hypothetical protein
MRPASDLGLGERPGPRERGDDAEFRVRPGRNAVS